MGRFLLDGSIRARFSIFSPANATRQLPGHKKGARQGLPAAPQLKVELENELAAEFEHAGIPRAGDRAEVVVRLQAVVQAK